MRLGFHFLEVAKCFLGLSFFAFADSPSILVTDELNDIRKRVVARADVGPVKIPNLPGNAINMMRSQPTMCAAILFQEQLDLFTGERALIALAHCLGNASPADKSNHDDVAVSEVSSLGGTRSIAVSFGEFLNRLPIALLNLRFGLADSRESGRRQASCGQTAHEQL